MVGSRLICLGYALNSQVDHADYAVYADYTVNHRRKQGVCQKHKWMADGFEAFVTLVEAHSED